VDPHWPLVLLLVIVTSLLNGLGLLACGLGSLATWPAVVCISTAAYRQLRANGARQGLEPGAETGAEASVVASGRDPAD